MTDPHRSPARTRRLVATTMVVAAVAVMCPGAAVAAPTVISAPDSAPVSLLHGESTPPTSSIRVSQRTQIDDPRRRTERRHRRRQDRRRLRLLTHRPHGGIPPGRSSPCCFVVDPRRHSPLQRRGPPGPTTDETHCSSCVHDRRVVGGDWSGPRAVTPTEVTRASFRSGAESVRKTARDTGRRTRPTPAECGSRRRPG